MYIKRTLTWSYTSVSSVSTSTSYSPGSVINPESLNKESLLKELNTQKERIATAKKRRADEISNLSDEKSNSKRRKDDSNVKSKSEKYNFGKKKAKFTNKHALKEKDSMRKLRTTDEGKEKNRETAKAEMSKIRKTDDGKRNTVQVKERMSNIRGRRYEGLSSNSTCSVLIPCYLAP